MKWFLRVMLLVVVLCPLAYAILFVVLSWVALSLLPGTVQNAWYGRTVSMAVGTGHPLRGIRVPGGALPILPAGGYMTAPFGVSPVYMGGTIFHTGVDIGAPAGAEVQTPIAGVVTFAGYDDSGYGNLVVVENNGTQMFFAHLSGLAVREGDRVDPGQVIGYVGSTGWSTGPHLHWEIRQNGVPVDPMVWLGGVEQ